MEGNDRLKQRYEDAVKASETFQEILKEPYSVIVRDATIQRFEYTFEALWKFLKAYLKDKEGIMVTTPKSVFREIGGLGVISEKDVVLCLEMTDRRNDTVHTYKEVIAQKIFEKTSQFSELISMILKSLD